MSRTQLNMRLVQVKIYRNQRKPIFGPVPEKWSSNSRTRKNFQADRDSSSDRRKAASMKIKIRDSMARINGDKSFIELNGIEIIADDGRELFSIEMDKSGWVDIHCSGFCKHNGKVYDDKVGQRVKLDEIKRRLYDEK